MLVPLYERLLAQPKRKRLWGCRRNQPLLEQSVGLFDVLDVPAFGQQARLFATSLGEAGAPFVTSLTSSSLPAILKAEEAISKVSSLVKSRFAGGVLNYRDAFPQDAFLRLWAGLALCGEGCHLEAISEFRTAQDLGYDHWRLSFYIAQAAAQLGEWFLVHHAIGAVLRVRPDFEPATALLALSRQRFQPALPASVPGPTTQPARPPRVTAIVSAYNSERFLRGCLEDLEAQTIAHELEIIVVDTASPQNERALVTEFQQRYSNIVYIRTEQRETVYGAWNRGLQAAHAPYVTNANTDDRHRPDALEKLAANLDAHPEITLVYADCLITRTENERFETAHPVGRFQWLDFDPQALLSRGCFVGPQPMWRRQVHEEHGYFDAQFVSAGDYEFWLRLAQNRKFLHVKETLGLYLESPTSVEHSSQDRVKREVPMAQDRYKKVLLAPAGTAIPFKPPQALPQPMEGRTRKAASIVLPPCALVGHLGAAKELIRQSRFPAAWEHTLTALKTRPFHPEAFLLLAEIALAAGNGEAARRSAQHARDIAPDFKPARQFLKGKLRGNAKPQWLVLPEALSAKDQAPRLSVCVIAKNEEQFLGRCLASVKGLADQIVVVDTGSTDRTVEIAKEHGAEIHSFSWTDDFSAARNSALEHVTGDWVLVLDADEELVPESHEALRKLISAAAVMAWRLPIVDMGVEEEGCSYVPRLFRNAPALFFVGRVHEQVFSSIEVRRREWGLDNRLGDAQLRHYGYTAQLVKDRDKITRNLRLLEKAIEELPDEPSLLMNYGLELTRSGDRPQGLEQYRRAFQLMGSQPPARVVPELREMLLSQFATQLTAGQHFEELISALTSPLARQGGLTASQHFSLGLALIETRQFAEAAEHMRQCLAKRSQPVLSPINKDIRKAGPAHCLALCLSQLQDPAGASEAFRRAMSEDPNSRAVRSDYARFLVAQKQPVEALQLYHALVAEQPNDEAAWLAGGQLALSHPEFLEVALDWTSEAMQKHPKHATVLAQRAEALLLAGRAEEAVVAWRETQPAQNPTALGALVLCETASNRNSPPPPAELEPAISQEFLRWYQRLVRYGAGALLTQVNARLDTLRTILPSAARVLTSALAEANTEPQGAER